MTTSDDGLKCPHCGIEYHWAMVVKVMHSAKKTKGKYNCIKCDNCGYIARIFVNKKHCAIISD